MTTEQDMHIGSQLKVLIVEDSPDDREMYRRMLQRQGVTFQIFEAGNVRDGLQLAREQDMDCILLDYKLPDGDGMDFIHSLHGQKQAGHPAIVMVTGHGSEKTAVEAMKLGALDYITKNSVLGGFFTHSILNAIERAQMKDEISRYQRDLVRSNAALSEFTHTASHDLKAPLRHIASYGELLQQELAGKVSPQAEKYLSRLVINANRIQKLVDDLLRYSEALNTREEKKLVDCNSILSEVLEIHEEVMRDSGAKIKVSHLPVLHAFPVRVKQLFQNLVSNALKYKSPEREPLISITATDQGGEFLFSVADNGCGIEDQFKDVIFQAFKRLHSRDEIEGSGLGLSICKKIIDMHGGRIWLESEPGRGTTFFFTIPKHTAAPVAMASGAA